MGGRGGCQLFGLVGDTGDTGLDGVEVAEVTALERRDGVLVRDDLEVVVELVHKGYACTATVSGARGRRTESEKYREHERSSGRNKQTRKERRPLVARSTRLYRIANFRQSGFADTDFGWGGGRWASASASPARSNSPPFFFPALATWYTPSELETQKKNNSAAHVRVRPFDTPLQHRSKHAGASKPRRSTRRKRNEGRIAPSLSERVYHIVICY